MCCTTFEIENFRGILRRQIQLPKINLREMFRIDFLYHHKSIDFGLVETTIRWFPERKSYRSSRVFLLDTSKQFQSPGGLCTSSLIEQLNSSSTLCERFCNNERLYIKSLATPCGPLRSACNEIKSPTIIILMEVITYIIVVKQCALHRLLSLRLPRSLFEAMEVLRKFV